MKDAAPFLSPQERGEKEGLSVATCSHGFQPWAATTRGSWRNLVLVVLLIVPVFLAPPAGPAGAAGSTVTVSMLDYRFEARDLTVFAGTTVVWKNDGLAPHTATSDSALWDSGTVSSGQSYPRNFNTPGTYPYHCSFHPSMTGTITVVAVAAQTYLPYLVMAASGW